MCIQVEWINVGMQPQQCSII